MNEQQPPASPHQPGHSGPADGPPAPPPHQGGQQDAGAPPGQQYGQPQDAPPQGQQYALPQGGSWSPDSEGGKALRLMLHMLSPLLIILAVSLPVDHGIMWAEQAAWAALTVLASLAQAAAAFPRNQLNGHGWTIGAAATVVLLLTWTLIFLPSIGGNRGFLVTLGVGAAAAAIWLSPERSRTIG